MRILSFISLVLIFTSLITHTAWAQGGVEFYSAKVPVLSQGVAERKRAASEGLKQVILRVSGSQQAVYSERLFDVIDSALNYVDQFQYMPLSDEELNDSRLSQYKEAIKLRFSPRVVEKILRDAEQRFWPINRPKTLVWLVEDNVDYGRQLVNQDNEPLITSALGKASEERGLPLMYPLLDLDDNIALPAEKAWALDEEAIRAASERYAADVILVGRYTRTSTGQVRSTWQYFHAGFSRVYDNESAMQTPQEEVLFGKQALYPLADFLAEKYSILPRADQGQGVVLEVSGISSFAAYRRTLSYLEGLAAVKDVHVSVVSPGVLLLNLNTDTDLIRLESTFELDHKLVKVVDAESEIPVWQRLPEGTLMNPLKYSWSR